MLGFLVAAPGPAVASCSMTGAEGLLLTFMREAISSSQATASAAALPDAAWKLLSPIAICHTAKKSHIKPGTGSQKYFGF